MRQGDLETTADDVVRRDRGRRGTSIGRYLVLDRVGVGGLGLVLAAYDPQLHRKVAIKLLHAQQAPSEELLERILREARALARVVHPNIVSVFDAGFENGELFVVMELVEGEDVRVWLRGRERAVPEIMGVFLQAGRGLVAAHEAGLVHRDFKPDNVLLGRDGRVRVADFGLARVLDAGAIVDVEVTPAADLTSTRTGAVVGTPAYMAPEQHASARVDERADQFAFCVALHEALHGARPFAGDSYDELADNVRSGRRSPSSGRRAVPAWIQAAIDRGLARDPEARFPTMAALLAALAADPAAGRRRRLRAWLVVAALAALAVFGARALDQRPRLCRSAPAEVAAAWSAERRASVEHAFLATGRPYAVDVLRTVTASLDAYAAAWSAMRTSACEATHFHGTQSAAVLDLRMRCLDGRLAALDAATQVLSSVDAVGLDKAVTVAGELPPVAACADAASLAASGAPPAAQRPRIDALATRLAAVPAQRRVGHLAEALAAAAPIVEEARALGHRPLLAEALLERGIVEARLTRLREAEITQREALLVAAATRDPAAVARAAVELASVLGDGLVRDDDVTRLRPFVDAALAVAGATELGASRATWLAVQGRSETRRGHLALGASYFQAALAERERVLPPGDPAIADALELLGEARVDLGDPAGARPLLERARSIAEAAYGPAHPEVARALQELASARDALGEHKEALALHERALAILEAALGPDHLATGASASRLGIVLLRMGDLARAETLFARALKIREAFYGPDHPGCAPELMNLAIVYARTGRYAEAERLYRRTLAIYEKAYGPDHINVGAALTNIGNLYLKQGRHAEALPLFERDLAIEIAAHGTDHEDVALSHLNVAEALEPLGRRREAEQALERARAIYGRAPGHEYELGYIELGLGRLALNSGRRDDAVPHLERAIALWEPQGYEPEKVAEARTLLLRAKGR